MSHYNGMRPHLAPFTLRGEIITALSLHNDDVVQGMDRH